MSNLVGRLAVTLQYCSRLHDLETSPDFRQDRGDRSRPLHFVRQTGRPLPKSSRSHCYQHRFFAPEAHVKLLTPRSETAPAVPRNTGALRLWREMDKFGTGPPRQEG